MSVQSDLWIQVVTAFNGDDRVSMSSLKQNVHLFTES